MTDDDFKSNLEWKKKGFDSKEVLTRKVDKKKAVEAESQDKNGLHNLFAPKASDLPKGLNKIRKKIRDVYDEDEDENDLFDNNLDMANNSLLNALHDNEKSKFKTQDSTVNNMKMQNDAGRLEALLMANKMSKDMGLKGLNKETMAKGMQDVSGTEAVLGKALEGDLEKKLNIKPKGFKKLSNRELITAYRGIKRVQEIGGKKAVEGMNLKEVMKAGEKKKEDKDVAEMILEKSGRKKLKPSKTTKKVAIQKSKTNIKDLEGKLSANR